MFYVYRLIDPRDNTPFYIGKGTGNRANVHLTEQRPLRDNPFKANVIRKIRMVGLEPRVEIVADNLTEPDAFALEIDLIRRHGRRDLETGCLTNLTEGGEGQSGWIMPTEIKTKIARAMTGESNHFFGKTHTEETRAKLWATRKREVSLEQRAKLSTAQKGKPKSAETRRKMSVAWKGRPKSPEQMEKIAAKKRGKPLSDIHRMKLRLAGKAAWERKRFDA